MNIPATRPMQFSLGALFEFTTICCAIASLASFVGIVSGVFLVAFALSLTTRSGDAAIFMVMAASLTAGFNAVDAGSGGYIEQLVVLLAAALISSWFWVRSKAWQSPATA